MQLDLILNSPLSYSFLSNQHPVNLIPIPKPDSMSTFPPSPPCHLFPSILHCPTGACPPTRSLSRRDLTPVLRMGLPWRSAHPPNPHTFQLRGAYCEKTSKGEQKIQMRVALPFALECPILFLAPCRVSRNGAALKKCRNRRTHGIGTKLPRSHIGIRPLSGAWQGRGKSL